MSRRTLAHLLLLATALVWGATFTLVKSALTEASPLVFNLLRMALATVILVIVNFRHLRGITRAQMLAGGLIGLFLAAGYQFQTVGLAQTTAAKSAFITGLVVVFVPALTLIPRFRPAGTGRPGLWAGAGAVAAFAGLLLLTTPPGTRIGTLFHSIGLGDWLTLCCALAFAAHLLTLGRYSPGMPAGVLATLQIGFCTVFMLVTVPLEPIHFHSSPRLWVALGICSVFATAGAFTIQSFAQQHLPPTHTVVLLTLEPVFAFLTAWLTRGETLDHRSLAGAALIFGAILLIELAPAMHTTEIPA